MGQDIGDLHDIIGDIKLAPSDNCFEQFTFRTMFEIQEILGLKDLG